MHSDVIHPPVTKTSVNSGTDLGTRSVHRAAPDAAVTPTVARKNGLTLSTPFSDGHGRRRSDFSRRTWSRGGGAPLRGAAWLQAWGGRRRSERVSPDFISGAEVAGGSAR